MQGSLTPRHTGVTRRVRHRFLRSASSSFVSKGMHTQNGSVRRRNGRPRRLVLGGPSARHGTICSCLRHQLSKPRGLVGYLISVRKVRFRIRFVVRFVSGSFRFRVCSGSGFGLVITSFGKWHCRAVEQIIIQQLQQREYTTIIQPAL